MSSRFVKYVFMWAVLVLLQVLLLNHIQISGYINPFLYIMFILLLPFDTPKYLLLFLGFFTGLTIDIFSNTLGIHASATTFLAFLRPLVINLISPRDVLEISASPRISHLGLRWFFRYTLILVPAHHFFLFYIEVFTLEGFIFTFFRSSLSSVFSIVLIILSQFLIYKE
ncbi:rod shape-determining protein MreD [Gaoshiqia sp. Z1-71]|uniref:rod shape-determining protein MreD n=1 Tax=Gaoshiqia hydrogeniformans TaxID=3290090 RepID=UPI003BF89461